MKSKTWGKTENYLLGNFISATRNFLSPIIQLKDFPIGISTV